MHLKYKKPKFYTTYMLNKNILIYYKNNFDIYLKTFLNTFPINKNYWKIYQSSSLIYF